jgi:hypothetical protein
MADAMPRAQYVELDDTAHGGPIFWADRVVPHLLDFWDAHREGG